jgi:Flp pilus assembly protein TadG
MGSSDTMRKTRRPRQKGIALLLNACMLIFTVAVVGLSVDAGSMYLIKARMNAAVDAASLAAGRSINLTNSLSAAQTAASSTATNFFNANFPVHYMGTLGTPTVSANLTQQLDTNGNITGVLNVAVTASAAAPTYFMNIFNISQVTVAATGTASRRSLVMVLVLDQSSSMNATASDGNTACQDMVTAAQNFITLFSPYDQIGLVKFDYTAYATYPPSTSYQDGTLNGDIGVIASNCGNNTNTTSALDMAYQMIQTVNLPLAENVIILFTDGSPNGITANFPVRLSVDNRWGPASAGPPVPPAQSGNKYGQNRSCDTSNSGDTYGNSPDGVCANMPVTCTVSGTVFGTMTQVSNQDPFGGSLSGLFKPKSTDSSPTGPAGCGFNFIKQTIAYIPDTDAYGNSTHGVVATVTASAGTPNTVSTVGPSAGLVTRDNWIYQVNCAPGTGTSPNCKFYGGLWSNYSGIGSGSNFFQSGDGVYWKPIANGVGSSATDTFVLRPDQPNTIVAASMNTAMAEAYNVRNDFQGTSRASVTLFHPVIHTIYLTGNGQDAIDHEFLPIISNTPQILPLPYDANPGATFTQYANPAFQIHQESGQYLVTSDASQLQGLFHQLASEVIRISH